MVNRRFFYYLFLFLITLFCALPLFKAQFVHWDDDIYVTENEKVQKGITFENIKWAFTTIYFGFYYPITWLSHMLDCSLFGLNPTYHHLTSVIIHFFNVILLYEFLMKLFGDSLKGFIYSSIFAAHPLNIESVGWISERKNLLAALFFYLGLNLYFKFINKKNNLNYALVYASFLLGMLSKPILVTFPFVLILIDYYKSESTFLFFRDKKSLLQKIPFLMALPFFIYITIVAQKKANAFVELSNIPLQHRIAGAFIAIKDYLYNFLFPLKLSALYPHLRDSYSLFNLFFSIIIFLGILILIYKLKGEKIVIFGFFWFFINLSLVLGIIQVGEQARADRYMYIPMVGLILIIVDKIFEKGLKNRTLRNFFLLLFIVVLILFSLKSFYQAKTWLNSETLFTNMMNVSKNASSAYHNLAIIYKQRGETDKAIEFYKKAIEIDPKKAKSYNNLGTIYAEEGKFDDAEYCFKKSIEFAPRMAKPYYNLGFLYEKKGDIPKAIEYYKKALELDPEKPETYNNLGICYIKKNDFYEASNYLKKAYLLNDKNTSILFNYGLTLELQGHIDGASELYQKILTIDEKHLSSRTRLIYIKIRKKKIEEAKSLIEKGLILYPNNQDLLKLKQEVTNVNH